MDLSLETIQFPQPVEQEKSSKAFMQEIRNYQPGPAGRRGAALWFLGQNSWVWRDPTGILAAIDPYLTDFCASGRGGAATEKSRRLPVFIEPEDFDVDLVLITHSHCDHTDPYTWERYLRKEKTRFMAPWEASRILESAGIPRDRITVMHAGQREEFRGLGVTALFAEPTDTTDLNHLGYLMHFTGGLSWYNTGDTAPSELLVRQIRERLGFCGEGASAPGRLDGMTVCINGGYNNLGHYGAARLTAGAAPRFVMPAHFDLMPHNLQMPHMFAYGVEKLAPGTECIIPAYYRAHEMAPAESPPE